MEPGVSEATGAQPPEAEHPPDAQAPAGEAHGPSGEDAEAEPPRKRQVAPAFVALDRVDDDSLFRLREEGDVAALATDIARLGQLFAIELRPKGPDRFQVITGFRRVAALRFLQREKVLARLHPDLSDDDALLMALAEAIHQKGLSRASLEGLQERLEHQGRLKATARDMLQRALATEDPLAPEDFEGDGGEEEEVDADELASDVTARLGQINQDLSLLADVFTQLEPAAREELLAQLRYSSELVAFLEDKAQ